jgi:hypothetical protein
MAWNEPIGEIPGSQLALTKDDTAGKFPEQSLATGPAAAYPVGI